MSTETLTRPEVQEAVSQEAIQGAVDVVGPIVTYLIHEKAIDPKEAADEGVLIRRFDPELSHCGVLISSGNKLVYTYHPDAVVEGYPSRTHRVQSDVAVSLSIRRDESSTLHVKKELIHPYERAGRDAGGRKIIKRPREEQPVKQDDLDGLARFARQLKENAHKSYRQRPAVDVMLWSL